MVTAFFVTLYASGIVFVAVLTQRQIFCFIKKKNNDSYELLPKPSKSRVLQNYFYIFLVGFLDLLTCSCCCLLLYDGRCTGADYHINTCRLE